jgi:hypothetical protein
MEGVIKVKTRQTGKKSKRADKRPARARYWARRTLEERKVKNLMRCCGMTRKEALKHWHNGSHVKDELGNYKTDKEGNDIMYGQRKGRVPAGYLRKIA